MFSRYQALGVLFALGVALLGFSLSVDYPEAAGAMWSDQATYYAMAHSLAYDGDLLFTHKDLERTYREFEGGPSGIFLKRGRAGRLTVTSHFPFLIRDGDVTEEIYFAKSFLYSAAAAPWVRLFGTNGMLVLHTLAVMAVLVSGFYFLSATSSTGASLGYVLTYLLASVAPAYFIWLTPELFNLSLVFLGLFFWLYKERASVAPWFLRGTTSDLIAAAIFGAVSYSKPSNVFLILPPLVLFALRRQWKRGLVTGTTFGLLLGGLFVVNLAVTGEMNYQGGDRKTFYGRYPFQRADLNFENTGLAKVTSEIYTQQPWDIVAHDLYFFHLGRFSGAAIYFFPAVAAGALFAFGQKKSWQWMLLALATFECLLLIVWMPVNYFGGGGTLGNRYFMNIYPVYFFLTPTLVRPLLATLPSWGMAGIFLTAILVNPFAAARRPGAHAATGPYQWLPVELSLINDLPTNIDPSKFRQRFEDGYLGYFLDDNTWGRERYRGIGFWVRGGTRAEMVVRTRFPLDRLTIRVLNVGVPNQVEVCVPGGCTSGEYASGEKKILELPAGQGFPYEDFGERSYCYLVTIAPKTGEIPLLARRNEGDTRYLGAFVHIEPDPYPGL